MPTEPGNYQELHGYRDIFKSGLYAALPGYARSVLLLLIFCKHNPSDWAWPGKRFAEKLFGLDVRYKYKGYLVLGKLGLFSACGLKKTQGGKVLAVKLNLEVPKNRVPKLPTHPMPNWDVQGIPLPEGQSGMLDCLSGMLGVPKWDEVSIEKVISLKIPKDTTFSQKQRSQGSRVDYSNKEKKAKDLKKLLLEFNKVDPEIVTGQFRNACLIEKTIERAYEAVRANLSRH